MKKTLAMLLVLFPVILEAHPGHGVGIGHEIFHYIISPERFRALLTSTNIKTATAFFSFLGCLCGLVELGCRFLLQGWKEGRASSGCS